MEAYAGFAEHTDVQVGRLIDALEEMGKYDDTLFIYIAGDNGASAEGGLDGTFNELMALNGDPAGARRRPAHGWTRSAARRPSTTTRSVGRTP